MTVSLSDRLLEILPGALTWVVLTSPLWLSFRLPLVTAILILFLDTYWVYRAFRISFYSYIGYRRMRQVEKIDWLRRLNSLTLGQSDSQRLSFDQEIVVNKDWHDFFHLLVIPTLKEPIEILEQTLQAIANQNYPRDKVMVLLAFEEREGKEEVGRKKDLLQQRFGSSFGHFFMTIHPQNYPGHEKGPGSNRTYAVSEILPGLQSQGIDFNNILLTTLDADFIIQPDFLTRLTYKYLTTQKAEKRTFTGIFWYYNNYWQAPFFTRLVASGVSFWQLSEMISSDKYMNFSSHSINLQSLIDMNFWVIDKVNDDGEFYWRAFYHFAGDYAVIPHYSPIFADAVQNQTLWLTLKEQYLQLRRWAYGVEHMPMIIKNFFKRKDIPLRSKTDRVLFLMRSYVTWSTLAILITFGGLAIQLINPKFSLTALSFNLPYFTSYLLASSIVGLFSLVFLHERMVPKRPSNMSIISVVISYLQWLFIPIILLIYGSLPAIDAQTRLLLGKYMEFRVTTKVRQNPNRNVLSSH